MSASLDHLLPLLRFRVLPSGQGGDLLRTPKPVRDPRRLSGAEEAESVASDESSLADVSLSNVKPFYGRTPGADPSRPHPRAHRGLLRLGALLPFVPSMVQRGRLTLLNPPLLLARSALNSP